MYTYLYIFFFFLISASYNFHINSSVYWLKRREKKKDKKEIEKIFEETIGMFQIRSQKRSPSLVPGKRAGGEADT